LVCSKSARDPAPCPVHAAGRRTICATRPEIIHVLQGILTEERNGGPAVDHKPGDVLIMKTGVTHALSNRSTEPAIYVSAPGAKQ
jgi:quercetin dioxygenase-like cupin family protein